MNRHKLGVGLILAVIFTVGVMIGHYALPGGVALGELPLFTVNNGQRELAFPTFWEAWDELHAYYIDANTLEDKHLLYGAVAGMVRAAGDPYTVFADPAETKQFTETLAGSFSGVGIEIGLKNNLVTVVAPLKGSPADQAGVQAGDIIVAIDSKPLDPKIPIDEVVQKIRGPKGTPVTLTVVHKDAKETTDITMNRDTIDIESVHVEIDDGVAHVTISNFQADTADTFATIAKQITTQGVKGILLDVRGNPGGYLQAAVEIVSEFVPEGNVVVSERGAATKEYKAIRAQRLITLPVVVLVDHGSASASEIVAGALRDIRSAPLVGEKTFGKGSVQDQRPLADGSSLRVTIAKWFTPSGQSIHNEGLPPTIEIKRDTSEENGDEQLQRAKEELKKLLP